MRGILPDTSTEVICYSRLRRANHTRVNGGRRNYRNSYRPEAPDFKTSVW
jgi:hypothetical protein